MWLTLVHVAPGFPAASSPRVKLPLSARTLWKPDTRTQTTVSPTLTVTEAGLKKLSPTVTVIVFPGAGMVVLVAVGVWVGV